SAVRRAARYPSSTPSSRPSLPSGSASEPSGFCGPWPDTSARLPRTRTNANGRRTSGGGVTGPGSASPSCRKRSSISIARSRSGRLFRRLGRGVLEPRLFLELLFDIAAQSPLHLRVVELPFPLRHDDGCHAVADQIG